MTYKIPQQRCKLVSDGRKPFLSPLETIDSAFAASTVLRAYYRREALPHERMIVLALNGASRIIGLYVIAEGGIGSVSVKAHDVFRPLLVAGAAAFIIAHNHPSGGPEPSAEDVIFTEGLRSAADVMGLPMLDHVIVTTQGETTSLKDRGFC